MAYRNISVSHPLDVIVLGTNNGWWMERIDIPSKDSLTIFGNHCSIHQSQVENPDSIDVSSLLDKTRIFIILHEWLKYVCFDLQEKEARF